MIRTTPQIHRVPTHAELVLKYEEQVRNLRAVGELLNAVRIDAPIYAYVNDSRWIALCSCGSCVAAHPSWPDSRCFECGAIYPNVVFPPDREAIEALLNERPRPETRNWKVGEKTADDLLAENILFGVRKVEP